MNLFKFILDGSESEGIMIIVLSVIAGISAGIIVILFSDAVMNIFSKKNYWFYLLTLPPMTLIHLVSNRIAQRKVATISEQKVGEMILSIANTIRHAELPEFEQYRSSGVYMSIAEAQIISRAATRNVEALQNRVVLLVTWLYIFFSLSYMVGLGLLIWQLCILFFMDVIVQIIVSLMGEESRRQTDLFDVFQHYLYGFKELKFNKRKDSDLFTNYLLPLTEKIRKIRISVGLYGSELRLIYMLSLFLLLAGCIFTFSHFYEGNVFISSMILIFYMMRTDIQTLMMVSDVAQGNAVLERLQGMFDRKSLKDAHEDINISPKEEISDFDSLSMENICFAYPQTGDQTAFSVSADHLTVRSGEILFITGGNGSGKSTLMKVITGLYPPDSGVIKIDNRRIRMADHRYLFSAIFADFHLFDRLYGLGEIDDQKIEEMLRMAGLEEKTAYRDGRFTTLELSTGQKKRLALVIALLEDRPLYVFDEWAADQDPHFRRFFYENILQELKKRGKTIIGVTHDDRYFHVADQVLRMEDGKIAKRLYPERKKMSDISSVPKKIVQPSPGAADDIPPADQDASHTDRQVRGRTKKQDGFLGKFGEIIREESGSLKRILFLMICDAFLIVSLMALILYVGAADLGGAEFKYFLFILIVTILFVIADRRMNRAFFQLIETRAVRLRLNMMQCVRKTDLMTLEGTKPGKIYTALTSDIREVIDTSRIFVSCMVGALRILMVYLSIGFLSLPAFLILIVAAFVGGFFYVSNHSLMMKLFDGVRDQEKSLYNALGHLFGGFKELRLNDRRSDDFYHTSLSHHATAMQDIRIRYLHCHTDTSSIVYASWYLTLLIIILALPLTGSPPYLLPVIVGMLVTMPINHVVNFYSQFHQAYLSLQQLLGFEETMENLAQEPDVTTEPEELARYEEIICENVSFIYRTKDGHPFSVGPVTFSFRAGEVIFITGGNGSGKSTFLKLITGLYYTASGRFLVNGKEADILDCRELFSPIFTDFHLFDRLYGMSGVDEEKLGELLRRFELEKRVTYADGRFNTLDLSTGQKKRLALITVMMEDKPIYIFDEWAADQAPHFREYFYKTLLPEFRAQGKTVIAVSHDDRYFHLPDRLVKMEYGQIVETLNLTRNE